MEWWSGNMDWPLDAEWKCPICGRRRLIWGLAHGVCRCDQCHTQYNMRYGDFHVTAPVCMLTDAYRPAFEHIWQQSAKPADQVTDAEWLAALEAVGQDEAARELREALAEGVSN
jgi:hypothetical protein